LLPLYNFTMTAQKVNPSACSTAMQIWQATDNASVNPLKPAPVKRCGKVQAVAIRVQAVAGLVQAIAKRVQMLTKQMQQTAILTQAPAMPMHIPTIPVPGISTGMLSLAEQVWRRTYAEETVTAKVQSAAILMQRIKTQTQRVAAETLCIAFLLQLLKLNFTAKHSSLLLTNN
jgi:hypothetical protein